MPTFAADEYADIAQRMKQLRDERAERLDRASAEAALEAPMINLGSRPWSTCSGCLCEAICKGTGICQMQSAAEPVKGDPGDEDDLGPWNYASYYFGDVRL